VMINVLLGMKMEPSDSDLLLKQATAFKRAGDINSAIGALRQAYAIIAKGHILYGVDPFLRLPLYLQEDGRNDEAWMEFNKLILEGYPNQLPNAGVRAMEHSKIYDKMRLFLNREGRNEESIIYGVLSILACARGLNLQKRCDEFDSITTRESVEVALKPLLKKSRMISQLEQFVEFVCRELAIPSKIDLKGAGKRTRALISHFHSE